MERNDNFGSTGGMGENTGAGSGSFGGSGLGNTGSTGGNAGFGSGSGAADTSRTGFGGESASGSGAYGAGGANYASTNTQGGFATDAGSETQGRVGAAKDAAADKLGNAKDVAGEKLGALKEKATQLTATLADKLEAGAERLREKSGAQGGSVAFAGGGTAAQDDRMKAVGNQLAGGMQGAADWLREGDLRATIETQVKEHPGRTLLIAAGLGYLLGKAFRR